MESFSPALLALARQLAAPPAPRPFLVAVEHADGTPPGPELLLRRVRDYFRAPARTLLADELGARIEEGDEHRCDEPLALRAERSERLERRVLLEALAGGRGTLPPTAPAWLAAQGLLPSAALGADAWQRLLGDLQPVLARAASHPLYAGADGPSLPPHRGVAVDVAVPLPDGGSTRLAGTLRDAVERADAVWWQWLDPTRDPKTVDFKGHVDLFLHYALLRLADPGLTRPVRIAALLKADAAALLAPYEALERRLAAASESGGSAALLGEIAVRLGRLVDQYLRARRDALPYWPRTSWAAAAERGDATKAWAGGSGDDFGGSAERDYAPGYSRLLARGLDPATDPRLAAVARSLRALLDVTTIGASP